MIHLPHIIADIGDVIQIILITLFVVGPILTRVLSNAGKAKHQPQPGRQPRNEPAKTVDEALSDEIEDFLRRASEQKEDRPAAPEPLTPRTLVTAEVVEPVVEVSNMDDVQTAPLSEASVASHVEQHMDSSEFAQRSKGLGAEVGHADEKLEDHIHDVFDHKLGRIQRSEFPSIAESSSVSEGTDAAVWQSTPERREDEIKLAGQRREEILGMLREPSSLRDAIILTEILNRRESEL